MRSAAAIFVACAVMAHAQTGTGAEPVRYMGGVSINLYTPEGNLRPAIGVESREVLRANRTHPELADGFGWTYNHAPMLAYWNGKFYLEYLSDPISEQRMPGHTLLVTSPDGRTWSKPVVVFPVYDLKDGKQAIMHQRMGFYITPHGRLFVLAFYGHDPSPFNMGGIGRVIREAHKDGTFGPIYFIRYNRHAGWNETNTSYPFYKKSPDKSFVAECDALLQNKLVTLNWWQEDQSPGDFYTVKGNLQALSFYHRADGTAVALWKHSLAALSTDEGHSWTKPVKLPTLIMSGAKVWGQHTKDGRYALVYNPVDDSTHRYPLAIITGDDGIHFDHMLFVAADLAPRRFAGLHKDFGLQYVRGIEEGNGTPQGNDLWITYSVNKEDIWVSRIPLPVRSSATGPVRDGFDGLPVGGEVPNWNIYSALWAPVSVAAFPNEQNKSLELQDRDPYDYARAVRVFEESKSPSVTFRVYSRQADTGRLEIELMDRFGSRPVRLMFTNDGTIQAADGSRTVTVQSYKPGTWYRVALNADAETGKYSVSIDGKPVLRDAAFEESVLSLERISLRTGMYRASPPRTLDPEKVLTDLPGADNEEKPSTFYLDDVTVIGK